MAKAVKYYRDKADRLLQEINRKEKPICEVCKAPSQVGHHFFTKGSSSNLRYDFDNIVSLCNGCHYKHHKTNDPKIHGTVIMKRGEDWYKKLTRKSTIIIKTNITYYRGVIEELTKRLNSKK